MAGQTPPSSRPLAQKYIRIKRVKLNGKGAKRDTCLAKGDLLQLYINDEFFDTPTPENAFLSVFKPQLDILYEDENLLLVNKRPGLVVPPRRGGAGQHPHHPHPGLPLSEKRSGAPYQEHAFAPALCNRIDRNTGGIVIAAKNAETLRIMNQKIRDREVEKSYLCLILGSISPAEGKLEGVPSKKMRSKSRSPSTKTGAWGRSRHPYRTWPGRSGLSLVACRLVTGRTHQIRAQFAAAGHPLWGMESMAGPRTTSGWAAPPARR